MPAERTTRDEKPSVPCPACRRTLDDVAFERAQLCNKCLALHHEACWMGVCASCGARPSAVTPALERKKPARKARSRAPWESVKLVAAAAWLVSFIVGNVALAVAWKSGWVINPFQEMPAVLRWLLAPYQICGLALVGIMTADAIVRGLARERGSGWPIVIALFGLCTAGISSFAYYLGWGRKPIGDDAPGDT